MIYNECIVRLSTIYVAMPMFGGYVRCDAWHDVSANVLLFNSSQTLLRIDACKSCYMMSKLMTATGTPANIKNNG